MSEKKKHMREFSPEFRVQAARLVLNEQMSVAKAAADLGMPEGTLHGWMHRFKRGRWSLETGLPVEASQPTAKMAPTTPQKATGALADAERRVQDLERQVRRLTMEREILKKAMAYCVDLPK